MKTAERKMLLKLLSRWGKRRTKLNAMIWNMKRADDEYVFGKAVGKREALVECYKELFQLLESM